MKEKLKKEDIYEKYLENFDQEFQTHIKEKIKEFPLLVKLLDTFIQEIYKPSNIYKIALKNKSKIKQELYKTMNKKQISLLEKVEFFNNVMNDDLIEQAFIYGYAMASEFREEAISKYNKKLINNK